MTNKIERLNDIAQGISLPESLQEQRDWYAAQIVAAQRLVEDFAQQHGWQARMRVFFERGVEIYLSQEKLWRRICEVHGIPPTTAIPTLGLAAALEKGILMAVTPELYAQVQPQYGTAEGAYVRLLAHEIAHRLHIAVLDGDEDAMGPPWFYEGFAVVASGDLVDVEVANAADVWEHLQATGKGAYAHYAAGLRFLMGVVPLEELVAQAGRPDFEPWLQVRLSGSPR